MSDQYNEASQRAYVLAGYKGGPFFKLPKLPTRQFVEGYPSSVDMKLEHKNPSSLKIEAPWFSRRNP